MNGIEEEMAIALAAFVQQVTEAQRKHFEVLLTKITNMMKWLVMSRGKPAVVEAAKPPPAKCEHCRRNKHHGGNKACLDLELNKEKHRLDKKKAEHEGEKNRDE